MSVNEFAQSTEQNAITTTLFGIFRKIDNIQELDPFRALPFLDELLF